jgi:hypothetical protein
MRYDLVTIVAVWLLSAPPPLVADEAAISDVRVAFEPKGETAIVRQLIVVTGAAGADANPGEIRIPLPAGAENPSFATDRLHDDMVLEGRVVVVKGAIPKEGRQIPLVFELPIHDGVLHFDQTLESPIALAHVAFVGKQESAHMSGVGFGKPTEGQIPSGPPALFMVAEELRDGHLMIEISGLNKSPMTHLGYLATIASFGILLIGFVLWLRQRKEA